MTGPLREPFATQAENEFLCEKLLGLTKHCSEPECTDWRTAEGKRCYGTPTFRTGDDMLLLLEALQKGGREPRLQCDNGKWQCFGGDSYKSWFYSEADNAPAAVRAAADRKSVV